MAEKMSPTQIRDDNNIMLSPNLTRYLNSGRTQTRPGRITQQQRASNDNVAIQQRAATIYKAGKKKKRTIAKKNLVIMYPSKHMDQGEDELNTTQLLFSPGATGGQVVHSMFSPPANNTAGGLPSIDADDLAFSPINCERMDLLAQRSHETNAAVKNNETGMCRDDYTPAQYKKQVDGNNVLIQIETGPEKENMPPPPPPIQQQNIIRTSPPAEMRMNLKTPAKLDESSSDSLGEFFTPCPKTPGTKSSSKHFTPMDEISYESLNTTKESKQYLLASHENVLKGGSWEGRDQGSWGEQERSGGEMVFITPKQRDDIRNEAESSSSDEDEFFSPLAHYNPQNDDIGEDLLEGSSVNLLNEVKKLLASKPERKILTTTSDESGEYEFFSPLAEHVPSNQTPQPISYNEVRIDQIPPIPTNNKYALENEPFEEGSTYRFINDAKSILAASKPETQAASDFDTMVQVPVEQPVEKDSDRRANHATVYNSFAKEANKPFTDLSLTPTPDADRSQVAAKPSFLDTSNSSPNNQNSPHLHSPSVSALPLGALTVDFVSNCECIETLNTILSVLNGSRRGKQLRQPRLVQFVQKRLAKLDPSKDVTEDTNSSVRNKRNGIIHEESQWQNFHHDNEWNVKLAPRITTGRNDTGNRVVWREDVKDNGDSSVQSFLSPESIIHESKHEMPDDEIVANIPVMITPKTVEVPSLTVPTSSPSIHLSSVAESSLDMNLSESFTLGDESAYWRSVEETIQEEVDPVEIPPPTESLMEVELVRELGEIREAYEKAKDDVTRLTELLKQSEKEKSSPKQPRNVGKLAREMEAARLANRALAKTLAVSEKDLADAIEARDIKARKCEQLSAQVNETSDQNAFLASKVKELEKELASCNSYIDSLYGELQQKSSSSNNDLEAELKKREVEWLELESRYNSTIKKLQDELNAQAKKVSMEMYLSIMKESRRHKMDAAEKQHTIDDLKTTVGSLRDEIQRMQRPPSKQGLKSFSSLHNKIRSSKRVSPMGDRPISKENSAPSR